ncbi:MAG: hypothetical protein U0234_09450 [Sandaracinus sp.]
MSDERRVVVTDRELDELRAKFDALPPNDGARSMVYGVQFFAS